MQPSTNMQPNGNYTPPQTAPGQPGLPTPQMQTIPLPVPGAPLPIAPQPAVQYTTPSTVPAIADDSDLIEKEWVIKTKQIIARTINDPHQQSKELNAFRADYMQKRYNKQIKLSE